MSAEHPGYIWVVDAAQKHGVSRQYLDKQVRDGKLTYATFPADRKTYLLESELDTLFSGPTVHRRQDQVG